jgi:hypothetical protein
MKVWSEEKIAFAFASLLVVGSTVIFGSSGEMEKTDEKSMPPRAPEQSRVVVMGETTGAGLAGAPWLPPSAGPREAAWIYELFGPPEIHFDASSQQLLAVSPNKETGGVDETGSGGREKAAIQRVPFRLQLVGHFGEGPDATGTFANMKTGETFLARAGRRVPELGLVIAQFKVTRLPVAIPDSMTTVESVAAAEVLDQASGEVTVLTDREWVYVDPAPIQPAEKFDTALQP